MYNFIINILDLKAQAVNSVDCISTNNSNDFFITLKVIPHPCPQCGCITNRIKGYRLRKLNHRVLVHSKTTIFYKQRRYFCPECSTSFMEHNPFGNTRKTITPTTLVPILEDLKHYTSTYSQVAKKYNVSVGTVVDIFDKHVPIKRSKLPSVMCIDEFYFNRHSKYKYAFMIMDFNKKVITDILVLLDESVVFRKNSS